MKTKVISIIDYGVCNVGSVKNMLRHCGYQSQVVDTSRGIKEAEKLILPGIGHFDHGVSNLKGLDLFEAIKDAAGVTKTPILGICLGMQLLGCGSEEGSFEGLGLVDGTSIGFQFPEDQANLKIPHMGWNSVQIQNKNCLTESISPEARFYFAHSYHMLLKNPKDVCLTSDYGFQFNASVRNENIYGVQFHPEKSHHYGRAIINNFAQLA
jgi:imidazole glycerol-phosphate synthase subunit HisH